MREENKRYTPKQSVTALHQKWLHASPNDPRLSPVAQRLAAAARNGHESFAQAVRELIPEL